MTTILSIIICTIITIDNVIIIDKLPVVTYLMKKRGRLSRRIHKGKLANITAIHVKLLSDSTVQIMPVTSTSYVPRASHAPVSCTKIQPFTKINIWICTGGADKEPEICEADICSIDEAPSTMRAVRWLGCDSCNKWYHGYCIKAKPSDYRKKTWLCNTCN